MSDLRLKSLSYQELQGRDLEWAIRDLCLGQVNLIVGKNATGKSRTLSVISNLAKDLSGEGAVRHSEADYQVEFADEANEITRYELRVEKERVTHELVVISGDVKLRRSEEGLQIWAEKENRFISFLPSDKEIAAVARRDKLQHSFLMPLRRWGETLRTYHFGQKLGKENLTLHVKASSTIKQDKFDDSDENAVVPIFVRGKKLYGDAFVDAIIADMKELQYEILGIDVTAPSNVKIETNIPLSGEVQALSVKEPGVTGWIPQMQISDGMFRALSIIVQVNYSQLSARANTIVIDDIGEGLDYERAATLVEILRRKAHDSKFQLIMSTNDRFVMNHVPLEEWSLLQRHGSTVDVRNCMNSRKKFEEFHFLGLSNFSFFEMDYLNEPNEGEEVEAQ